MSMIFLSNPVIPRNPKTLFRGVEPVHVTVLTRDGKR